MVPRWRVVLRSVAAAALCVVATALVYLVSVRTSWGQQVGNDALAGRSQAGPESHRAGLDLLGTISVMSLAASAVGLMLLAAVRERWLVAVGVAVLIGGANLNTQVLKRYVLGRPDLLAGPAEFLSNSLPSGHATVAATLALGLLLVAPRSLRSVALVAGALYAGGVGVAVLATGWHRAGDAVAAWGVAGAWTFAVIAALAALSPRVAASPAAPPGRPGSGTGASAAGGPSTGGPSTGASGSAGPSTADDSAATARAARAAQAQRRWSERTSWLLGVGAVVTLAVWAAGLLVALAFRHSTIDQVRNGAAFWSGCAWIVGSLLGLLALVVWCLREVPVDGPAPPRFSRPRPTPEEIGSGGRVLFPRK